MARSFGGCFSKNASMGAPKSERLVGVGAGALFEGDRFAADFFGLPVGITDLPF
jgi:hypothetical protein